MFIVVAFLIVKLRKETVKAEKETKRAYNEISQIFRITGNGLRVIDRDFNMIRFNDAFLNLSGLHRKEAIGKKCFEAFPSPECHTPNCILHRVLEGEKRVECDTERERSDGSKIFCTPTATPLRGPEGEVFAIVEDIKDITDRLLWEEKLKRSEEKYRSFVKGIKGIAKDGQIRWIREYTQHVCDPSNKPIAIQGILYDITEQKETEEALQKSEERFMQAQKMEAIGRLAGGIAHDFNNILTIIMGNTDLLLDKVKDNNLLCDIEEIQEAGERASSLVRRILAFSRKQMIQPRILDLTVMLTETEKLIRRIIGEDINLTVILDPDLSRVKVDPGQMDQAILNLVVNARDAMPNGGDLTIRAENIFMDKDQCKSFPDAHPGRFVCLSVEDNGTGMDKTILNQIFEPFFTTKKPGEGTGLGLSTVYGIVKQHEGWINVYSHPGYGSKFEIYLPAISQRPTHKQEKKSFPKEFEGSGERVLIVEDNEGVRRFAKKALEANGYVLYEFPNFLDALSLFDREKANFDLVLSDVVLPDINGLQFVDKLLARNPDLQVILCSGYANVNSLWPLINERDFRFIKKPFSAYDLLRSTKEVISSKKAKFKQNNI